MNICKAIIFAFLFAVLTGCRTEAPPTIISFDFPVHVLRSRTFTLSETNQIDNIARIRLVGLAPDGMVSIRSFQSGSLLQSNTNGYFPSRDFGSQGLRVLEVNQTNHSVVFENTSCEGITAQQAGPAYPPQGVGSADP